MEVVGDGNTTRIKYTGTWTVSNITGADGGTVHSTTDPGSHVSLEFTGTSIQIDALKSPNGANYTVLLDGTTYGPYSLYSATNSVGNVWNQSQLNPTATHTITLQKVLVSSGPGAAFALNVDAFRIASAVSSSASSTTASTTSSTSSSTTSTSSSRPESTSSFQLSSSFLSSSSSFSTSQPPSPPPDPPPTDERPAATLPTSTDRSQTTSDTPSPDNDPTPDADPDSNPDPSPTINTDDLADPSFEPAPTSTASRSSSRSQNSTSTSHTSSHGNSTWTFSPGVHVSHSASAAAVSDSSSASSGPSGENRVGVILGSVVAVIIFLCLITIPIIYIKRKREQNLADELKASTTPAYQTRSAKGLLMPLGVYRRSTLSPTSPRSFNRRISHHWGFGSNSASAQSHGQSPSPNAMSPSPIRAERPTSFEDREGRSHYLLYPDVAPLPAPLEHGRQRTDSYSSDYPYPLSYHTPR